MMPLVTVKLKSDEKEYYLTAWDKEDFAIILPGGSIKWVPRQDCTILKVEDVTNKIFNTHGTYTTQNISIQEFEAELDTIEPR